DLTKEHLTETFKPKKNIANNVIELYSEFLKEKKQQGTVTARTLQKYNVVFLKYKSFCAKQFKSHKIKDLDDNFYVAFLAYLRHKDKLNDNTLARYLTFFKTFVIWCNRKGFDVNNDYTNVSVKKYQSDDVALNSKEVEILENADLNGSDEKARDLFLIGVYSGQRFSDYSVFERADIQGDFIIKRSEKTENHSIIPLHDKLKNLLDKYDWRLPKISSQKFNVRMQSVCKDLGFDNEIKKTTYRGSQKTIELLPLWKMVASHTARRTYITLMAEKGMADHFIMAVTGIKDAKTLSKYKKLNKNNLFTISESLWK
ncbi:MAG: phage integrase SAM-like domain-containing protein, partial [Lacinutrix sp.]|uniref:tyrosine-type recombinase/integrase n=1 Tax=Lacinutrix sp. TaxID=1937692 RepID=UPI00309D4F2E